MRFKAASTIVGILLGLPVLQAQQNSAPSNAPKAAVVMTVGLRNITVPELCSAMHSLPPPQRKGYELNPALARDWFGPLVAMAEEAKREGLIPPQGEKLSEVNLDNALTGELIQSIAAKAQPGDAEIANYYAVHKSDFEQADVRHILISHASALASRSARTPAEAKSKAEGIALQLKQEASFRELAANDSDDPYTQKKGGELGYVSHHQLEPAVDAAVWSLAPGQISTPFEGRFGFEIIEVETRRVQPLEEVRENIAGRIKADALQRKQQEIVAAANIRLEPAFATSPLPCQEPASTFTLKDSLQGP